MAKLEHRKNKKLATPHTLSGWELIAALSIMAAAAIGTVIITGSTVAVTVVVAPLLLVLGVKVHHG